MANRINRPIGKAAHESFRVGPSVASGTPPIALGVPEAIAQIDEILSELGKAQRQLVVSDLARKYSGGTGRVVDIAIEDS